MMREVVVAEGIETREGGVPAEAALVRSVRGSAVSLGQVDPELLPIGEWGRAKVTLKDGRHCWRKNWDFSGILSEVDQRRRLSSLMPEGIKSPRINCVLGEIRRVTSC